MAKGRNYTNWSRQELIDEIEYLRKQKTYGLVYEKDNVKELFDYYMNWDGFNAKEKIAEQGKFPVLKEIKGNDIKTSENDINHILIEGDNYHSLGVLNFTHNKAIDVIYIDPPYNTGNKDFIYNDQYVDKEDGYRHSKWLNFMEKRLKLARNLLKDTGVIFISIDDNEYAQLKILCDEIFGENNFIGNIIWKKSSGKNDSKFLAIQTEYILMYKKSEKLTHFVKKDINVDYKYEDEKGKFNIEKLDRGGLEYRKNSDYIIKSPEGDDIYPANDKEGYFKRKNGSAKSRDWQWRLSEDRFYKELKENAILFKKTKSGWSVYTKRYETTESKSPFTNIIDFTNNASANKELQKVLGERSFTFPKPVNLIEFLIALYPKNKTAIILDFMAGSGTTGHAVLKLNKEDNGNRKFILCTNNENNICSDVCYPRLGNVIKGYKENGTKLIEGLGGNLKYFKTDFVNSEPTDKNKREIVDKSAEMICLKEDAFEFVTEGLDFKIYRNKKYFVGIIFEDDVIEDFIEEAKKLNGKFNVYAFTLDGTLSTNEFKEIKNKVKLCPIPDAILHIYKKVLKND